MNSNTIVKIILFIFLTTFFGFLFWYFYQPEVVEDKEQETDQGFVSQLFPFGNNTEKSQNQGRDKDNQEGNKNINAILEKEDIPRLRQISQIPTAGVHIETISKTELFDINKDRKRNNKIDEGETYSEIRYISTKNNHVFQTYDFTLTENRISNTSILKIFDAQFFNKNNFIVRYNNNFGNNKTYSITLRDKTDVEIEEEKKEKKDSFDKHQKKFQGLFFPDDIENISINKNSNKVFYTTLLNTDGVKDGKLYGVISTKESENKTEIFSSELKEWNFNFNNSQKIFLSSKVASNTPSIPFSLNIKNANLSQISAAEISLNGIPNYNFSKIVFSQRDEKNKLGLVVYNTKTKEKTKIAVSTFIEKCVWSKNNIDIYCAVPIDFISENQPDDWYKGKNYFRDDIFKINTNDLSIEIVFDSLLEDKKFDIIDLKLDDREKYLYWKNKKTDFAWSYELPFWDLDFKAPIKKLTGSTFSGEKCTAVQILNQNLQPGDRDGKYSTWQKATITEVKILQAHMNRLGFNAGIEDGILGKNTAGAIKRMQKFLGTYQDAKVGPITRGLLNNSC